MKMTKAFELYLQNIAYAQNFSSETINNYTSTANSLVSCLGDINIKNLNITLINNWRYQLSSINKIGTISLKISCLRQVLKYIRSKHVPTIINYQDIIVPRQKNKAIRWLSTDEIQQLINSVNRRARGYTEINRLRNIAMIQVLASSGIRVSELCRLDRDSIRDRSFVVVGKSKEPRVCFINNLAEQGILNYLALRDDCNPALFVSSQVSIRRITPDLVRTVFRFARNESGINDAHPHLLRHSFASTLLDNNVDLRYIADLLGHQSLDTTRIYTHFTSQKLQHIYDCAMN